MSPTECGHRLPAAQIRKKVEGNVRFENSFFVTQRIYWAQTPVTDPEWSTPSTVVWLQHYFMGKYRRNCTLKMHFVIPREYRVTTKLLKRPEARRNKSGKYIWSSKWNAARHILIWKRGRKRQNESSYMHICLRVLAHVCERFCVCVCVCVHEWAACESRRC